MASNINVIYTSLKSTFSAQQFHHWQCGSIFICLAAVASQKCEVAQNSEKIWTYSSSSSSEATDLGANWKHICDFLSCTVSEIRWLIGWKLCIVPTHLSFGTPAPYVPTKISQWSYLITMRKLRVTGQKLHDPNLTVFDWSTCVTVKNG